MQLSCISPNTKRPPVMLVVSRPLCWSVKGSLKLRDVLKCRVLHLDSSGVLQTKLETDPFPIDLAYVRQRAQRIVLQANQVEEQMQELVQSLPKEKSTDAGSEELTKFAAHRKLNWESNEGEVFVKTTREPSDQRKHKRRGKVMDTADDFRHLTLSPFARDNKSKLLTSDEEKELAVKIQRTVKINELRNEFKSMHKRYPSWSELAQMLKSDMAQLQKEYREGMDAKHVMLSRNMRLVISVAAKMRPPGRTMNEVIADGSAGLIRAIEKFDPDKGYKLSTYAHWWIRQFIARAAAESKVIRVPLNVTETFMKIMRAQDKYRREHGVQPTEEELMRRLGLSRKRLRVIQNAYKQCVSLDAPLGDDGSSRLDFVEDQKSLTPEESYAKDQMRQDIELIVSTLPAKEATILRLRYGLDDGKERTLEDIGHLFHVTRERVRQLEARALRKLRQRSGNLKEYLEPVENTLSRSTCSASLKHS